MRPNLAPSHQPTQLQSETQSMMISVFIVLPYLERRSANLLGKRALMMPHLLYFAERM
jgi:hypothetical protein